MLPGRFSSPAPMPRCSRNVNSLSRTNFSPRDEFLEFYVDILCDSPVTAKKNPRPGGRGTRVSFVRSSRLTRRPTRRRGQQGGNPPQAALSRTNVGRLCFLPSERWRLIWATHRIRATSNDGPLPVIDETRGGDRSSGRHCRLRPRHTDGRTGRFGSSCSANRAKPSSTAPARRGPRPSSRTPA